MGPTQDIANPLHSVREDWSKLSRGGKGVLAGGVLAAALGAVLCAQSAAARSLVRFVVWAGAGATGAVALLLGAKFVTDAATLKVSPEPRPMPQGDPRAGSLRLLVNAVVEATRRGFENLRPTSAELSQRARLHGTLVVLKDGKMVVGGPANYQYELDASEDRVLDLDARQIVNDEGHPATELQFRFVAGTPSDAQVRVRARSWTDDDLNHSFWIQPGG